MSVLIKHMAMPKGCIYANDKDQTEYCPLLNHDDVPFCRYIENEPEAAIGIDERPVYCPLEEYPEPCEDAVSRKLMYELGATCMARRNENGELVALGSLDLLPSAQPEHNPDDERKIADLHKMVNYLLSLPEQRWIPVTLETLPNPSSVVVVCGKKGTWDYGTYRGWHGNIHSWKWKENTIKHVYWWMYKTDALPEPYREEGEQDATD